MFKKIYRFIVSFIGFSLGYTVVFGAEFNNYLQVLTINSTQIIGVVKAVILLFFTLFFYFIAFPLFDWGLKIARALEKDIGQLPREELLPASLGLIFGLSIAFVISPLIGMVFTNSSLNLLVNLFVYGILGYLGFSLGKNYFNQGPTLSELLPFTQKEIKSNSNQFKILDTSVLIDGRIVEIAKTGFLEGQLIIPEFVLQELQYIADSADDRKRVRGRRGLDVVDILKNEVQISLRVSMEDFAEVSEVDSKLVKLAQKYKADLITNDFNLNKVASIQNIRVLNINQLATALSPVVLPNEVLEVEIVKRGKEAGQGLAYLDDGTMVVVKNGQNLVGQSSKVVVTRILQVASGKMIFAEAKEQ